MQNVQLVRASITWPLRHRVLRPNQPLESSQYSEDSMADARRYAILENGLAVAIASVYPECEPGFKESGVWRLRGMASSPEVRGLGLGRKLLTFLIADLRAQNAKRIWCNARESVSGFYSKHGFAVESDVFEMPGIGPHLLMKLHY